MELRFECPECKQPVAATTDLIGVTLPCPGCQAQITVPNPLSSPEVTQPRKKWVLGIGLSTALIVFCLIISAIIPNSCSIKSLTSLVDAGPEVPSTEEARALVSKFIEANKGKIGERIEINRLAFNRDAGKRAVLEGLVERIPKKLEAGGLATGNENYYRIAGKAITSGKNEEYYRNAELFDGVLMDSRIAFWTKEPMEYWVKLSDDSAPSTIRDGEGWRLYISVKLLKIVPSEVKLLESYFDLQMEFMAQFVWDGKEWVPEVWK